ncbi:MAG: glycosyltransferase family 39 protein [Thermomicrobiales bacterium]
MQGHGSLHPSTGIHASTTTASPDSSSRQATMVGAAVPGLAPATVSRPNVFARMAAAVLAASVEKKFIAILLLVFLAKGITISFIHVPFSGHDEVAHYSYLEIVATEHRMPIIPDLKEWQAAYKADGTDTADRMPAKLWPYCQFVTRDWNFCSLPQCDDPCYLQNLPPDYQVGPNGWIYTANHPPLYYIVMTPLYWLSDGWSLTNQLYLLRLAVIPFGMLTVLFSYLAVRTLFPTDRFLAFTVPAFVAFQPQISYESAMLNNDILAIAFTSGVVWLVILGLKKKFPIWNVLLIGFLYGLAMLSKNTSATAGAIIAFAMIAGLGWKNWKQWIPKGALAAITAGLLVWPWYLFMWTTYGNFTALPQIRELQWWNYTDGQKPTIWSQLSSRRFFWARWGETWGDFGWRMIPLSETLLRVLFWIAVFGVIGLGIYAIRFWRAQQPILAAETDEEAAAIAAKADGTLGIERWQVVALVMLGLSCLLAYFAILQFGLTFALTQARYFFPAITAGAILMMLGIRSWFPPKWLPWVQVAIFVGLLVLNLVIYSEYVIPWSNTGQFSPDFSF